MRFFADRRALADTCLSRRNKRQHPPRAGVTWFFDRYVMGQSLVRTPESRKRKSLATAIPSRYGSGEGVVASLGLARSGLGPAPADDGHL
jgi:hypothetical protein